MAFGSNDRSDKGEIEVVGTNDGDSAYELEEFGSPGELNEDLQYSDEDFEEEPYYGSSIDWKKIGIVAGVSAIVLAFLIWALSSLFGGGSDRDAQPAGEIALPGYAADANSAQFTEPEAFPTAAETTTSTSTTRSSTTSATTTPSSSRSVVPSITAEPSTPNPEPAPAPEPRQTPQQSPAPAPQPAPQPEPAPQSAPEQNAVDEGPYVESIMTLWPSEDGETGGYSEYSRIEPRIN